MNYSIVGGVQREFLRYKVLPQYLIYAKWYSVLLKYMDENRI